MSVAYPASFKTYPNGQVGAFFTDVPEAMTCGTTRNHALELARDALTVAFSGYLDRGRDIPMPGKPKHGQPVVVLSSRVVIKIAIYTLMREQGVTQTALADRLGIDGRQVRRILDLDHESRLSQMEAALAVLGMRAEVRVSRVRPSSSRGGSTSGTGSVGLKE
ncbi:MAG: hypothetical protein WCP34_09435 [Pseudomonadota bacterium]